MGHGAAPILITSFHQCQSILLLYIIGLFFLPLLYALPHITNVVEDGKQNQLSARGWSLISNVKHQ